MATFDWLRPVRSLHHDTISRMLTHWGRVTHICITKLTTIGSDNGLSPGRRQAIIWTNAGILLIQTLGPNFSEILREIYTFSFKKMHLKMSAILSRPQCVNNQNMVRISLERLSMFIEGNWTLEHNLNVITSMVISIVDDSSYLSNFPLQIWGPMLLVLCA